MAQDIENVSFELKQKVAEILTILESGPDKDGIKKVSLLIRSLREALGLNLSDFATRTGVSDRTARRWEESGDGGTLPRVTQVKLWETALAPSLERSKDSTHGDRLASVGDRLVGEFSAASILAHVKNAATIWSFKSRSAFRAAYSVEARNVFLEQLDQPESEFVLNCVWIETKDIKDSGPMNEARPATIAGNSFWGLKNNYMDVDKEVYARIASRIRGWEIPLEVAANNGLANGPVSMLIIIYTEAAKKKYVRPLDVFYEFPVALYDPVSKLRVSDEERHSWFQLHPPLAEDCWNNVWNQFKSIESLPQAVQRRLEAKKQE